MNRLLKIILCSLLLAFCSCREIVNPFEGEQTLAKVGEKDASQDGRGTHSAQRAFSRGQHPVFRNIRR
ncbi:MAG: hypothetical protein L6V35_04470 [Alistipes putredinis]|nr:MAG: hypothetical protein L6V35_04470 [Alistipes putredinis]